MCPRFSVVFRLNFTLKLETVRSSEIPLNVYQTTQRHAQEEGSLESYLLVVSGRKLNSLQLKGVKSTNSS
jgi:hypothetical protein